MADLTNVFTKALTDLLSQNESRFLEQKKLVEDLQKQIGQLREEKEEKDRKFEEQDLKLTQLTADLDKQSSKLKEQTEKLNEQTTKLNEQSKILKEQAIELEEQRKINEKFEIDTAELEAHILRFKNIRIEDICEWIKLNTKLGHEVMNLLESKKNNDERVKSLQSTQRKHQQLLDGLVRSSSVQSPFRPVVVKSPSVSSHLNGNTNSHHHQQHNSTPRLRFAPDNPILDTSYQRSPYYSVEPDDELSQLSDGAESLIRTVDGLNQLHRCFNKTSINSDDQIN